MLQVQTLREERERVVLGLLKRNIDLPEVLIDQIIQLDDNRKATQMKLNSLQNEANQLSKEIGSLMKSGNTAAASEAREKVNGMKDTMKALDSSMESLRSEIEKLLYNIPNVPHSSVPKGRTAEDNEVFKMGDIPVPVLPENCQPHWELAKKYNIFDLELGVKLTGAGFPVYRGKGAKLQRALINFFLDNAFSAGYEECQPPLVVNADSARGTGQLPDKEAQMYYIERDDLYLIPTAEVPLTNIFRNEIVEEKDLPIKICGYTPCFRREAGSYGAHVRGLNRVHQFDKIEIVRIEHPDRSYNALMDMVSHVESLLLKLKLPYRILRLCGGDMGFNSALTFDFEVFSAAQQKWLEVSSVSNFETFQTNRMQLRFRNNEDKKLRLAHSLNGSALALARIVASILENYQTESGIMVPEALRPYTGFEVID